MKKQARQILGMCPKILLGAIIDACGVALLMSKNGLITGGVMGLGMTANHLFSVPAGVVTIILNIPLFILAWRSVGLRFLAGSALGMGLCSVLLDLFNLLNITITGNPMLAALFGGFLSGLGQGLIYSAGGSTGGVDIVAKIIRRKRPYINLGMISLCLNAAVFVLYAIALKDYEAAMYSAVAVFVSSKMLDTVLYGFNFAKVCYIITGKGDEISKAVTVRLGRGVTVLDGRGAYTGNAKSVLLCAIRRQQIVSMRKLVQELDPDAFVIVSDTREIMGHGFEYLSQADS